MSTPTTPPAWLEAAAKLDALIGDKVPLSVGKPAPSAEDVDEEEREDEAEPETPELDDDAEEEAESSWEHEVPIESLPFPGRQAIRPAVESRPPAAEPVAEEPPPQVWPRPRIAAPPAVVPEPAEETDLAWHGYAVAALLPSTFALAAVTVGTIIALRPLAPAWVMREAVDAPLAALWLLQAIRAAYRLLAYDYRLTTRRLFRGRGPLYPPEPPLELAAVVRADVRQTVIDRLIGVGTVRVIPEDATPSQPAVELAGVRRPKVLAAIIDEAAKAAREGNVVAARVGEPAAVER
ncbi:MAG TPA: hypothetical protein VGF55_31250 [Gemmataceae bacterium]|jgi:hypothetical protein